MRMLIVAISFCALAVSLIAEFGFDLKPCPLCYVQRGIYLLLLFACLFKGRWSSLIRAALLAIGAAAALYLTLIQLHLIEDRCKSTIKIKDPSSYKILLTTRPAPTCSERIWTIWNIPIASVNVLVSSLLLFASMPSTVRAFHLNKQKQQL